MIKGSYSEYENDKAFPFKKRLIICTNFIYVKIHRGVFARKSSFIWVNNIYSFEDLMAYKNIRMYSLQRKAKSTVRNSYWEYKCVYDRYVFVQINLQYILVFYLHMKHFRSFYHSRKQIKQFIEIFFIFYKI